MSLDDDYDRLWDVYIESEVDVRDGFWDPGLRAR